ncbi:MAG: hypothetical protein ABSE75_04905 [Acidimicrobiales bacterium]|jgi:hypothetical protein
MMKLKRRRSGAQCVSRTLIPTLALVLLLGLGSPVGASTPSSVALAIAEYALATATHDSPAHVVTAADVTNAASINTVNTTGLELLINVDDVFGYSRLVLFFEPKSFADICLNVPDTVGGAPKIIACPHHAQGLWNSHAGALDVSNRAIAAAAAAGHPVSGADVVAAAKVYHLTLHHKPTFRAGQGGKVEFTTLVEMGLNTKFTVNNCVQLPKTAYGLPVEVPC